MLHWFYVLVSEDLRKAPNVCGMAPEHELVLLAWKGSLSGDQIVAKRRMLSGVGICPLSTAGSCSNNMPAVTLNSADVETSNFVKGTSGSPLGNPLRGPKGGIGSPVRPKIDQMGPNKLY